MVIRKAKISDVKEIQKMVEVYAQKGEMLQRSLSELYDNLRDFYVYEEEGEVAGVCALHISWDDLAEVRSLVVAERHIRKGIGKKLVTACVDEAREFGIKRVFALTYQRAFFEKLGFHEIDKMQLPHKIWGDCVKCSKFPDCDEIAMVMEL
ncbi:MAG: N-acetylglutamate synthase [Deltaproteobacteria bacterium]|nr:N-acetylglutamate synthase [Deltaproteobacteria bacterium]